MIMNYFSPDMEGFIPKTDSRYRGDLRYYEDGRFDESENEYLVYSIIQNTKFVTPTKTKKAAPT